MKNRTRWLCMILTLVMAVSLLTACGKSKKNENGEEQKPDTNAGAEESKEKGEGEKEFFPLEEKEEYTLWTLDNATMTPGYEETATAKLVEDATNVHLKVAWVTLNEAQEKFGLMIASGDIPDMVYSGVDSYYAGGPVQAVQDGLFQDMTDLIDQYMPNYKAMLDSNEQLKKDVTADDGKRYSVYSIYVDDDMGISVNRNVIGLAVRRDWLQKAGLDMPVTIADWTEALAAFKAQGAEAPLMIGSNGRVNSGAFLSAFGVLEGFYMDGDTVMFGPAQEGYKQYLQQMKDWYDAGLLDPNFTANNRYVMMEMEDMGGDKAGAGQIWWQFGADELKNVGFQVSDDFYWENAPFPVLNEGDTPRSATRNSMVSLQLCVNADVTGERLETLCRYLDYQYTEESMLYHNYGEEGVHYTVSEDGQIFYSDKMTKDPDNNVTWMRIQNLSNGVMAGAISMGVDYASYPDGLGTECLDMQPVWNADYSLAYPTFATMTGDETTRFNTIYTDISTLVDEMSSKFILGVEPLSNFDDFVNQLYQYGLQECIDLRQAAYDRYQAR